MFLTTTHNIDDLYNLLSNYLIANNEWIENIHITLCEYLPQFLSMLYIIMALKTFQLVYGMFNKFSNSAKGGK